MDLLATHYLTEQRSSFPGQSEVFSARTLVLIEPLLPLTA